MSNSFKRFKCSIEGISLRMISSAKGFPSQLRNVREKTINPFSGSLWIFLADSPAGARLSVVLENTDLSFNSSVFHKRPTKKKPCWGVWRLESLDP